MSQVVVIGYELGQERFGGDPAVVDKNIRIDGKLFTIIGITRKWFTGMIAGSPQEITIPAGAAQLYESRSMLWVFVTGRLNEGTRNEQTRTQLQTFWLRLLEDAAPTQGIGPRRQSFPPCDSASTRHPPAAKISISVLNFSSRFICSQASSRSF